MNLCGRKACSRVSTDGLGASGIQQIDALEIDHVLVGQLVQLAQLAQRLQPHRRQAGRLDHAHVPARALDADHLHILAQLILDRGLDRGVAAAMQHQLRIAAQQPRGVGAHRQIRVDALGGVIGRRIPARRRQTSCDCIGVSLAFGKRLRKPSGVAAQVPRSVIKPVTSRAGVTSKPGLAAAEPGAAISTSALYRQAAGPVIFSTSSWLRSSMGMSRPDSQRPVDGGAGQRHIEGHVVVLRRQRLQIGADLVGDIAIGGDAVGAHDHHVHLARLHVMAAGIVGQDGVRHAMAAQFERGQRGALVARPGFVHPDMQSMPASCAR